MGHCIVAKVDWDRVKENELENTDNIIIIGQ